MINASGDCRRVQRAQAADAELVVDAAVRVLVRDGLDGLSVRKVASESGDHYRRLLPPNGHRAHGPEGRGVSSLVGACAVRYLDECVTMAEWLTPSTRRGQRLVRPR